MPTDNSDPEFLWGCEAIARFVGIADERRVYYLLQQGVIPGRKVSRKQWVAHAPTVRAKLSGVTNTRDTEPA